MPAQRCRRFALANRFYPSASWGRKDQATDVCGAARTAYCLGAVEVYALTPELTVRPLRRLAAIAEPT